jgi:DNA-binding response OmpR family regulator
MHVVHVEDERPLRDILKIALQATEPRINLCQFISGDEAMPYVQQHMHSIDLYILDIRLPGTMSGLDIAHKIRALKCPGYVVLTSAYSPPEDSLLLALRCEYYPKPWHLLDLTQKLLKYRLSNPPGLQNGLLPT